MNIDYPIWICGSMQIQNLTKILIRWYWKFSWKTNLSSNQEISSFERAFCWLWMSWAIVSSGLNKIFWIIFPAFDFLPCRCSAIWVYHGNMQQSPLGSWFFKIAEYCLSNLNWFRTHLIFIIADFLMYSLYQCELDVHKLGRTEPKLNKRVYSPLSAKQFNQKR